MGSLEIWAQRKELGFTHVFTVEGASGEGPGAVQSCAFLQHPLQPSFPASLSSVPTAPSSKDFRVAGFLYANLSVFSLHSLESPVYYVQKKKIISDPSGEALNCIPSTHTQRISHDLQCERPEAQF